MDTALTASIPTTVMTSSRLSRRRFNRERKATHLLWLPLCDAESWPLSFCSFVGDRRSFSFDMGRNMLDFDFLIELAIHLDLSFCMRDNFRT
ncbi:hypothetical protein EYC80_005821 [Monilinia laxa]|uniref:Uncharacterized protein n=1 Tax=Monilinia laxa TaxID=61186 RepID=A0A5N6KF41_MONLA|nr:hypothetical protein EYC80_005821 [Monilinia laxa]